jgi:hypothetical protein
MSTAVSRNDDERICAILINKELDLNATCNTCRCETGHDERDV